MLNPYTKSILNLQVLYGRCDYPILHWRYATSYIYLGDVQAIRSVFSLYCIVSLALNFTPNAVAGWRCMDVHVDDVGLSGH
eukprot:COSAG02_NODE_1335_length_13197_cov_5.830279_10_plen_81_part_00